VQGPDFPVATAQANRVLSDIFKSMVAGKVSIRAGATHAAQQVDAIEQSGEEAATTAAQIDADFPLAGPAITPA